MSKTTVDPNALMMKNVVTRKAKKEAEIDAKVASVADRLGPGRIKKRAEVPNSQPAAMQEGQGSEEKRRPEREIERLQPVREEKRTTVDIPVELLRDVDKVLFARKMRGEKATFKDFFVGALRAAVEGEQGK